MKFNFVCVFLLLLVSCNLKQNNSDNRVLANAGDSINNDSIENLRENDINELDTIFPDYSDNYSYNNIKIFEPIAYNQCDYTNDIYRIMDTLVGLFSIDNKYQLKQCWIEKTNVFENDCYGGAMIEPTLNTKNNCLFLFKNLKAYNNSKVIDTMPANLKIWTNETKKFTFNNVDYLLNAKGIIFEKSGNKDDDNYNENIKNYRLYLTCGDKKQCIIAIKQFNDSMTEICWIGDIDGDNKPDFIIKSPSGYEDYCLLLFLSSFAEGEELVKLVSITIDSFAC